ncbi:MAG: hypothetical protein K0R92_2019 [Lachnospiraceae bacterium]|nr:hypothetical protein [Lachnospiraceae bacterium]
MKRTTRQYIIVSVLSIIIIGGAFIIAYFTVLKKTKENYQQEISILEEQLESREVYVYEAKEVIPTGSIITKENLKYVKSYSNQSQEYFMTEKEIGMTSLIQIETGTQILKGMLTDKQIEENVREVEYNIFLINSNILDNDSIDVRLLLPNGEDYIVISKKSIKQVDLAANNCFLWLTEEEILTMSSAVVDAYLYPGAKLYMTKYVEPNLQNPSIPTYQPSLDTLALMEENENIVELASVAVRKRLRTELEGRLKKQESKDDLNYEWEADSSDTNNYSNNTGKTTEDLTSGTYYEEDYFIEDRNEEEEVIVEYGG